jgi:hypothetical protein
MVCNSGKGGQKQGMSVRQWEAVVWNRVVYQPEKEWASSITRSEKTESNTYRHSPTTTFQT